MFLISFLKLPVHLPKASNITDLLDLPLDFFVNLLPLKIPILRTDKYRIKHPPLTFSVKRCTKTQRAFTGRWLSSYSF